MQYHCKPSEPRDFDRTWDARANQYATGPQPGLRRKVLIDALLGSVPAHVLKLLAESVASNDPILWGNWAKPIDGKAYGCLMCDGLFHHNPEAAACLLKQGECDGEFSDRITEDYLPELYDSEDTFVYADEYIFAVANAFDCWMTHATMVRQGALEVGDLLRAELADILKAAIEAKS